MRIENNKIHQNSATFVDSDGDVRRIDSMGFNSLDCLGVELFPTQLRSTAMAITLVAARVGAIVGNLVFGYLVESHCATPILMVAALLFGKNNQHSSRH